MADWKALCEELTEYLALLDEPPHELVCLAQERLAQLEPEVVEPSDVLDWIRGVEPWATWLAPGGSLESAHFEIARLVAEAVARWGHQPAPPAEREHEVASPTQDELWELWLRLDRELPDRPAAVAAFWEHAQVEARARCGRPAPAPAGEVAELVAALRIESSRCTCTLLTTDDLRRAADLLERLASPACVVLDSNPEAIAALEAASPGRIELLPEDAQVIEPAQHTILAPAPVPVALSERPWEREGWCDSEGRCWIHCPGQSWDTWVLMVPQNAIDGAHCLPATALPLPSGEVE